ncbi:hypothetical protein ACUN22_29320 [Streptomyces anulatus]|uniref:hypothetical protein n=1 Tax=Streptomyces anulatus TaxID=1892 RepID=UPI00403D743E
MGDSPYTRERLAEAVAVSTNWTDLLRRLGLPENGGRRRTLQQRVAEFELDTSHLKQRSPRKKYPDSAIAAAVKTSGSLREVVTALGVPPRWRACCGGVASTPRISATRAWQYPKRP